MHKGILGSLLIHARNTTIINNGSFKIFQELRIQRYEQHFKADITILLTRFGVSKMVKKQAKNIGKDVLSVGVVDNGRPVSKEPGCPTYTRIKREAFERTTYKETRDPSNVLFCISLGFLCFNLLLVGLLTPK